MLVVVVVVVVVVVSFVGRSGPGQSEHAEAAYNEFFEAFKNYQETGNATRAKIMLKYPYEPMNL